MTDEDNSVGRTSIHVDAELELGVITAPKRAGYDVSAGRGLMIDFVIDGYEAPDND